MSFSLIYWSLGGLSRGTANRSAFFEFHFAPYASFSFISFHFSGTFIFFPILWKETFHFLKALISRDTRFVIRKFTTFKFVYINPERCSAKQSPSGYRCLPSYELKGRWKSKPRKQWQNISYHGVQIIVLRSFSNTLHSALRATVLLQQLRNSWGFASLFRI